jgi:hypothetical protein
MRATQHERSLEAVGRHRSEPVLIPLQMQELERDLGTATVGDPELPDPAAA